MGHDIYGIDKKGKEIAYARFSMGNTNAGLLYGFLDAYDYHAGVSGCGRSATFSFQQIEKAFKECNQFFNKHGASPSEPVHWDQKQIQDFIQNCFTTAQKEHEVKVYFG